MTATTLPAGIYTFAEACDRLGIGLYHGYRLDNDGAFPVEVLYLGSLRKVRIADLERYLATPERLGAAGPPRELGRLEALLSQLRQETTAARPSLTLLPGGAE